MTPLHCQATAAIMLLVLPTAAALVPGLSIPQIRSVRYSSGARKSRAGESSTRLLLGVDPSDVAQHAHVLHQHVADPASILDQLSSLTLAKASSVLPNHSLAPLSETMQSGAPAPGSPELIPDMTSMPGGAPRTGNPFVAESLREIYSGTVRADPQYMWSRADGAVAIPARELDVVGRYADLMNRIPLAAAVYALVDFFLINAEEDIFIAELVDEEEAVKAIVEVENRVMFQRFVGLMTVVAITVGWSLFSYHPVPFNEL